MIMGTKMIFFRQIHCHAHQVLLTINSLFL